MNKKLVMINFQSSVIQMLMNEGLSHTDSLRISCDVAHEFFTSDIIKDEYKKIYDEVNND